MEGRPQVGNELRTLKTQQSQLRVRCHHKVPLENGGTDKYSNLVLVTEAVHILIHATVKETIQKYLKELQLN